MFGGKSTDDFHHPTKPELTSVGTLSTQLNANSVLGCVSAHRGQIRNTTAMA